MWPTCRWCLVLFRLPLIALLAAALLLTEASFPRVDNSSTTMSGEYISSTAWHARTLTNISWDIPARKAQTLHVIVISLDEDATESWRFDDSGDNTTRAETPPSQTTTWTSYFDAEIPPLSPDEALSGSCAIQYEVFTPSLNDTFYRQEKQEQVTPVLADSSMWWYTASLDQEKPTAATSLNATVGTASVLLSEPGLYTACLLVGNETCYEEECVDITVYQPPDDFIEVSNAGGSCST